jgi:UDP-N-acetylmuramyl tripeptide synthase
MSADSKGAGRESGKANRLYWESDESVNAIADALGVSKGRLYDLIDPLAAGVACPDCGAALAFPNRTARDRGMVTCDACGFEGEREEGEEGASVRAVRRARQAFRSATGAGDRGGVADAAMLGGILVGLAAGIGLYRWLRS